MANDNVCFSAKKGEIHAICGENGAGKSTLMKLLFGVEQPNQGRIIMRGQEVKLTSPMKAIEMGISTEECLLAAMALNLKRMVNAIFRYFQSYCSAGTTVGFQQNFCFCQQVRYCTLSSRVFT